MNDLWLAIIAITTLGISALIIQISRRRIRLPRWLGGDS
jgi:hypothetical protein